MTCSNSLLCCESCVNSSTRDLTPCAWTERRWCDPTTCSSPPPTPTRPPAAHHKTRPTQQAPGPVRVRDLELPALLHGPRPLSLVKVTSAPVAGPEMILAAHHLPTPLEQRRRPRRAVWMPPLYRLSRATPRAPRRQHTHAAHNPARASRSGHGVPAGCARAH